MATLEFRITFNHCALGEFQDVLGSISEALDRGNAKPGDLQPIESNDASLTYRGADLVTFDIRNLADNGSICLVMETKPAPGLGLLVADVCRAIEGTEHTVKWSNGWPSFEFPPLAVASREQP